MSASAFKQLFENPAFKQWYNDPGKSEDSLTIFQAGREQFKSFIRNSVGDFVISEEQLQKIVGDKSSTQKLINQVRGSGVYEGVEVRQVAGQTQLFIPELKYSTLNNTVRNILDGIASDAGVSGVGLKVEHYLEENPTDIGHVFGFSNTLINRVKTSAGNRVLNEAEQNLVSAKNIGDTSGITQAEVNLLNAKNQVKALEDFVDSLLDVLEEYDIATSDIQGLDLEVNTKYRKTSSNWLFEWQGSVANQESGRKIGATLGRLKQTKTFGSGLRGMFSTALTSPQHLSKVLKSFVDEFATLSSEAPLGNKLNILEQKGSPSIKELVVDELKSIISGKPREYAREYVGETKLKSIPLLRVDNSADTKKAKSDLLKVKASIKQTKTKLNNAAKSVRINSQLYSLTSLQSLINTHLHSVIAANMGDGNSRNVLNYQTGRFASTVKVERMSQSREGMITAFYSYMQNPYATFSEGGRQSAPKSRDPKLLIAKSIREIAAEKVGNRMRAVLA